MRRLLPVVQIVGLLGCDPEVPKVPEPERPTANPPEPIVDPPVPDVITPVSLSTVGELNAASAKYGRVYTLGLGKCGVDVPLPPDVRPSSGISLNVEHIDCPPEMLDPVFQECSQSILTRIDAENCSCTPVTGNPPRPAYPVSCPGS